MQVARQPSGRTTETFLVQSFMHAACDIGRRDTSLSSRKINAFLATFTAWTRTGRPTKTLPMAAGVPIQKAIAQAGRDLAKIPAATLSGKRPANPIYPRRRRRVLLTRGGVCGSKMSLEKFSARRQTGPHQSATQTKLNALTRARARPPHPGAASASGCQFIGSSSSRRDCGHPREIRPITLRKYANRSCPANFAEASTVSRIAAR